VKQLGSRAGNWLNRDQARQLLERFNGEDLRSLRDLAMISVLLGRGLRRAELAALEVEDLQIRQGHWVIVDLVGKGVTFGLCQRPFGLERRSIAGCWRPGSTQAGSLGWLAVIERHGVKESPRTSYGM